MEITVQQEIYLLKIHSNLHLVGTINGKLLLFLPYYFLSHRRGFELLSVLFGFTDSRPSKMNTIYKICSLILQH
jgi:hypothetical protein